jgi:zinc/manganese transport system substrate-binding protein
VRPASLLAVLLTVIAAACTETHISHGRPGQITVVATTTQMQDLVRQVGGRYVQEVGILQPNVDPHDFEPTPSTAIALADARLVVESGVGVDSWADDLVSSSGSPAAVFVASAGLPIRGAGPGQTDGGDPHWWFDPMLFERAALALGRELGRVDPGHAAAYRRNAAAYAARIQRADAANRRLIAGVPPAQRKLVTNHDAFAYFAAHYGITVVGSVIPSLSSTAEPGAQSLAQLIGRIRAQHVPAVFTESSLNPSLEQQIAGEAGVRVEADLYGDTLGPPGSPGATYIGMLRWDMRAMVAGFLGRPAP